MFCSNRFTDYFRPVVQRGDDDERAWSTLYTQYSSTYPAEYVELQQRLTGRLPHGWQTLLPPKNELPTTPQPTRKSSGIAVAALVPKFNNFIAGSADLLESTFVSFQDQVEFQNVNVLHLALIVNLFTTALSPKLDLETTLAARFVMGFESLR